MRAPHCHGGNGAAHGKQGIESKKWNSFFFLFRVHLILIFNKTDK